MGVLEGIDSKFGWLRRLGLNCQFLGARLVERRLTLISFERSSSASALQTLLAPFVRWHSNEYLPLTADDERGRLTLGALHHPTTFHK